MIDLVRRLEERWTDYHTMRKFYEERVKVLSSNYNSWLKDTMIPKYIDGLDLDDVIFEDKVSF